jgi:PII-like signaling protein
VQEVAVGFDELGTRVVIFLSEDDRIGHRGLHESLLDRAREDGMAGATVWRAIEGFGTSGRFRTARSPDALIGLPLAVEVIDLPERIEAFLDVISELAPHSFVTREQVAMSRLGPPGSARPLDDPGPESAHRP